MKKIFFLVAAALAVTACQKDPDYSELSDEYMVFTTYDNTYDFSSPTTIYVPQSILLLGYDNTGATSIWQDTYSDQILSEFATKLNTAGYTVTRDGDVAADLNLNVSFLENVQYFVTYPYWWWDPYWWDDDYWPDYYPWYYPYPVVYGYTTGSLIAELALPGATSLRDSQTLPSKWYSYITGPEYGTEAVITPYLIRGVDQAFAQSPYLKNNSPR